MAIIEHYPELRKVPENISNIPGVRPLATAFWEHRADIARFGVGFVAGKVTRSATMAIFSLSIGSSVGLSVAAGGVASLYAEYGRQIYQNWQDGVRGKEVIKIRNHYKLVRAASLGLIGGGIGYEAAELLRDSGLEHLAGEGMSKVGSLAKGISEIPGNLFSGIGSVANGGAGLVHELPPAGWVGDNLFHNIGTGIHGHLPGVQSEIPIHETVQPAPVPEVAQPEIQTDQGIDMVFHDVPKNVADPEHFQYFQIPGTDISGPSLYGAAVWEDVKLHFFDTHTDADLVKILGPDLAPGTYTHEQLVGHLNSLDPFKHSFLWDGENGLKWSSDYKPLEVDSIMDKIKQDTFANLKASHLDLELGRTNPFHMIQVSENIYLPNSDDYNVITHHDYILDRFFPNSDQLIPYHVASYSEFRSLIAKLGTVLPASYSDFLDRQDCYPEMIKKAYRVFVSNRLYCQPIFTPSA